jgi:hypothetical protein
MTDKQTFEAMLRKAKVIFSNQCPFERHHAGMEVVIIKEGEGSQNIGYNQFFSEFLFEKSSGDLISVGAWE